MQDYPFEKSEYNYLATVLIFGQQSPYMEHFSIYSLDTMRKNKNIYFSEFSGLNPENHMETRRTLSFDPNRDIETNCTEMSSEVNKIVTYIDTQYKISISDTVFSEEEYRHFDYNWDKNVQSKIKNLGLLIKALYDRDMSIVPIFINEFPNILKTLLNYPEYWLKKGDTDVSP